MKSVSSKPSSVFTGVDHLSMVGGAIYHHTKNVIDETKVQKVYRSGGNFVFKNVNKFPNVIKTTKIIGKVATVASVASTAWDMIDIIGNNQLNTEQKILGCGVAVGQFVLGFGVGVLASMALAIPVVGIPLSIGISIGGSWLLDLSANEINKQIGVRI